MKISNKEKYILKSNIKHNNLYDYSLISESVKYKDKVEIICKLHGIFIQRIDHHMNGCGCQKCSKNYKYTTEEFIIKLKEKYEYDCSLIEYIDSHTPITVICLKHGKFEKIPNALMNGIGCPKCYNENRNKTNDNFLIKANNVHNNNYEYLSEYIDNKTILTIKCKKCGNIFEQRASKHLFGQGCSICNISKGENNIRNYLLINNIIFIEQQTFDGCKNIRLLKFDFYLTEYNICIEYDGKQHFEIVEHWNNDDLNERIKRDNIKTEYCKNNNIKLIRISYKEYNKIEEILNDVIK